MGDENAIYIDRGSSDWSAFQVTPEAWAVVPIPPARIVRSRRTGEMPEPAAVADFGPLRNLLRGLDEDSFILFIAWCLGALSPSGPYPLLLVSGQAGIGQIHARASGQSPG